MFSTGLSSGAREGRRIMVMFLETARAPTRPCEEILAEELKALGSSA